MQRLTIAKPLCGTRYIFISHPHIAVNKTESLKCKRGITFFQGGAGLEGV
jgi:hypothetical protein